MGGQISHFFVLEVPLKHCSPRGQCISSPTQRHTPWAPRSMVCWSQLLLFPESQLPNMQKFSTQSLEIGHRGSIYTKGSGKHYKSGRAPLVYEGQFAMIWQRHLALSIWNLRQLLHIWVPALRLPNTPAVWLSIHCQGCI